MKNLLKYTWVVGLTAIITGIVLFGLTIELVSYVAIVTSIYMTGCYIPQIVKTIRTKNVESISLDFWANLDVALLSLTVSTFVIGYLHGTWATFIVELLNLTFALIMTGLVLKYKIKGGNK